MNKQFVSYKIAKLLQKAEFKEVTFAYYYYYTDAGQQLYINGIELDYSTISKDFISAPLWQQVEDWLREKYNIEYVITKKVGFIIINEVLSPICKHCLEGSHYDLLEKIIQYVLEKEILHLPDSSSEILEHPEIESES